MKVLLCVVNYNWEQIVGMETCMSFDRLLDTMDQYLLLLTIETPRWHTSVKHAGHVTVKPWYYFDNRHLKPLSTFSNFCLR